MLNPLLADFSAMENSFQPLKSMVSLRSGLPARDLNKAPGSADLVQVRVLSPASLVAARVVQVETPVVALPREVVGRHSLKEGSVVVSARGEFVACLLEGDPIELTGGVPLVAGPLCHVLTPQQWSPVLPAFLVWLLGTEYANQRMGAAARGSATTLYSLEVIGSLPVPVLPLDTQKAIAEAYVAGRELYDSRRAMAEAEHEANIRDLSRIAGILS